MSSDNGIRETTRVRMRVIGCAGLVSVLAATAVAVAPQVAAKRGDKADRVQARGACFGGGSWKLQAKPDNGRIEVEAEIDSNRRGQVWKVRLFDNGTGVFKGKVRTKGRSGSAEIERHIANLPNIDRITVRAKRVGAPQLCQGSLSFRL